MKAPPPPDFGTQSQTPLPESPSMHDWTKNSRGVSPSQQFGTPTINLVGAFSPPPPFGTRFESSPTGMGPCFVVRYSCLHSGQLGAKIVHRREKEGGGGLEGIIDMC